MNRLRVPAVLAVALIGCGDQGTPPKVDARAADASTCPNPCIADNGDGTAATCPDPAVCVSDTGTCPAGCACALRCFAQTTEGQQNCPYGPTGLPCASPEGTCPAGCDPVT